MDPLAPLAVAFRSVTGCPDPSLLEAFCRGTLAVDTRAGIELHLDRCSDCASTVAELARLYGSASWGVSVGESGGVGSGRSSLEDTVYVGAGERADDSTPPVMVGRYQLGRRLGAGGMGMVFEAHDPELHRLVAVKLLHAGMTEDAEVTRARLLREARAMARLAHPNVVAVHDVGGVGQQVFVAMELVHGTTLNQWLRSARRSQKEILTTFVQAGRGLEAAHAVGLVHRDFKPDNVLIGADGRARVTDFGLARPSSAWAEAPGAAGLRGQGAQAGPVGATTQGFTAHGAIVGTPAYMAPEQWRGVPADARSDQFSFCLALYEALFGTRPFAGDSPIQIAEAVLAGRMTPVPRGAPGWLRTAITRGLAREPEARHPSMTVLLEALERDRGRLVRVGAIAGAMAVGAVATVGVLAWMADSTTPIAAGDDAATHAEGSERGSEATPETGEDGGAVPSSAQASSTQVECEAKARTADGRWTPERRAALRDRIGKMEDGEQVAAKALPVLDAWALSYGEHAARECAGGSERPHAEARRRCLHGGLARFEALVGRALELETFKVQGALAGAAFRLPSLRPCGDEGWLSVAPAMPSAELAPRVQLLVGDLAAVDAEASLEQLVSAPQMAERVAKEAEALGYPPLHAEAQLATGLVAAQRRQHDIAVSWLEPAALTAQSTGHERALAMAAIALLHEQGAAQHRFAEVERWDRVASTAVDRFGDAELRAALMLARGRVLHARGELREARSALESALAPHREAFDDTHPRVAAVHLAVSDLLLDLGDVEAARKHAESAHAMLVDRVGPSDLDTARAEASIGRALLAAGDLEEAEAAARRAVKIVQVSSSLRHDYDRGRYIELLGDVLAARGAHDEALAEYERAKIYLYDGAPRSEPLLRIGPLLVQIGRAEEGLRILETALAQLEEDYGPDDPRLLDPLRTIGRAQLQGKEIAAARTTLERAVALADSAIGYGPRKAAMQIALAEIEQTAGEHARALELYDDAHVPWVGAYDMGHPEVTRELLARADLAWGLGQSEYAGRLYGSSYSRIVELFGESDPAAVRARERRAAPE